MGIPFYNFSELHNDEFKTEIKERISEIIDQGAFIDGKWNQRFETEFATMQGAKHALLVANGTDAIEIALEALGVGHGDLVGVPGITFYATSEAVLNRSARPVWIDVDPSTGLMCTKSLERVAAKHKMKAIIPVHIYGLPANMEQINAIAQKYDFAVIEDAAQAQGAFLSKSPVGGSGHMTTFSFYPTKNLSAFGDAGAISVNDDKLADKIKLIRNHGRSPTHPGMGRNSRCDHIQAATLQLKLSKIELYNKMRKEVASLYFKHFEGLPVQLVPAHFIQTSSWHLFPIQLKSKEQRQGLQLHLSKLEIGCQPFYEFAQSELPVLKTFTQGEDTEAKKLAGRVLCLPIHPFVKDADIKAVKVAIETFLKL